MRKRFLFLHFMVAKCQQDYIVVGPNFPARILNRAQLKSNSHAAAGARLFLRSLSRRLLEHYSSRVERILRNEERGNTQKRSLYVSCNHLFCAALRWVIHHARKKELMNISRQQVLGPAVVPPPPPHSVPPTTYAAATAASMNYPYHYEDGSARSLPVSPLGSSSNSPNGTPVSERRRRGQQLIKSYFVFVRLTETRTKEHSLM
jgi:hypothetical protein